MKRLVMSIIWACVGFVASVGITAGILYGSTVIGAFLTRIFDFPTYQANYAGAGIIFGVMIFASMVISVYKTLDELNDRKTPSTK